MQIFPSLASADPMHLGETIRALKGCSCLHFDIEDGNFVPNITFGMKTIRTAAKIWDGRMDAHLMVTNPQDYLSPLAEAGFEAVAFHWETAGYPLYLINRIHQLGMKAGIALNPRTSAGEVFSYGDKIDYVLVMTSEPDGEGDAFQEGVLDKIQSLAEASKGRYRILADGGIGEREFCAVKEAGADAVVMGRAVFRSEDPLSAIHKLI